MDVLYIAASGSSDPTRASIPWHIAVNGSVAAGQDAGILLAGDATEVLRSNVRAVLVGVGVPPIDELITKARDHSLPVFV
jgi:predicted peroxiredoxin